MFKKIIKYFKKKEVHETEKKLFNVNKTALILAYEVAKSDGEIDEKEVSYIKSIIEIDENRDEIFEKVAEFSNDSSSFYDQIREINENCSLEQKESLIGTLWNVAYSDEYLEVHEEKIIRRIADLLHIKDVRVLKLKNDSKEIFNN